MSTRLHIVVPDGVVALVDRVRGDVPRSAWVRRAVLVALSAQGFSDEPEWLAATVGQRGAVERALSEAKEPIAKEQADPGFRSPGEGRSAAPAEQPVRRHAVNCKCSVCS